MALTPRAVAGAGAGSEAIRNETGDGLTNPLPNRTGAAVRLCNALKGYPDVPRYWTKLIAVRSIQPHYREILPKKQAPYNRFHLISKSKRKNSFLQLVLLNRFQYAKTSFSVFNGAPPNTLNLFSAKCIINFHQRSWNMYFLLFQDLFNKIMLVLSTNTKGYCLQ